MKNVYTYLGWITLLLGSHLAFAQQSTNTVNYQVTYYAGTGRYTAWVVPNYNTPNSVNNTSTEKGGTAQFSIKYPRRFPLPVYRI